MFIFWIWANPQTDFITHYDEPESHPIAVFTVHDISKPDHCLRRGLRIEKKMKKGGETTLNFYFPMISREYKRLPVKVYADDAVC